MSNKSKFTPIQIAEFEHLFNGWVLFLKNDLHCFKDAQVEVMKEHVSETDLPKDVDIPEFAQQSFLHALNKFYVTGLCVRWRLENRNCL